MIISTPRSCRIAARRLNRLNDEIRDVLTSLRRGGALHCRRDLFGLPLTWFLSDGRGPISDQAARVIIARGDIVCVGDTLFEDGLAQTYRYSANT